MKRIALSALYGLAFWGALIGGIWLFFNAALLCLVVISCAMVYAVGHALYGVLHG